MKEKRCRQLIFFTKNNKRKWDQTSLFRIIQFPFTSFFLRKKYKQKRKGKKKSISMDNNSKNRKAKRNQFDLIFFEGCGRATKMEGRSYGSWKNSRTAVPAAAFLFTGRGFLGAGGQTRGVLRIWSSDLGVRHSSSSSSRSSSFECRSFNSAVVVRFEGLVEIAATRIGVIGRSSSKLRPITVSAGRQKSHATLR